MTQSPVGAARERLPHIAPGIADQNDRGGRASIGKRWHAICRNRLKAGANEQTGIFQKIIQFVDHGAIDHRIILERITRSDANVIGAENDTAHISRTIMTDGEIRCPQLRQ